MAGKKPEIRGESGAEWAADLSHCGTCTDGGWMVRIN
jgi:hypothetical protein